MNDMAVKHPENPDNEANKVSSINEEMWTM